MNEQNKQDASVLLEVVPLMMRFIRTEMRKRRGAELTVPHFRVLAYMGRHAKASLSEIAEFIGISLPAASLMVDALVKKNLARREISSKDRRRIELTLTPKGKYFYEQAREVTLERLSKVLLNLTEGARANLVEVLKELKSLFLKDEKELK